MYYVTASYDYCINAVKTFDLAKMGEIKDTVRIYRNKVCIDDKNF
jgi:hypothetical protein